MLYVFDLTCKQYVHAARSSTYTHVLLGVPKVLTLPVYEYHLPVALTYLP